jgi:DNA-3-methyladenine glycosylase II
VTGGDGTAGDGTTTFTAPDAADAETALVAARTLADDDLLGPVVTGVSALDPASDLFERLVVSILRQQVSVASAAATRERLFDAVAVTPQGVLAADPEQLREAGLSRQKTRYVRAAAEAFRDEAYSKAALSDCSNETIRDRLTEITGVGPWTANMQLLFTFGRPDVFPVGDLGIRKGVERLADEELSREEIRETATRWAPFRSYASLYLWALTD